MEKIVLGLGSNVGNSMEYLRKAVNSLSRLVYNPQVSSVYKTKPQDYLAQADFLNLVFCGEYDDSPENLLICTQKIERENGRERKKEVEKGPRTLDIDILLFGKRIINTQKLIVPHPAMKKRQFVLIPLLEILPNYADPISKTAYSFFLKELEEQGVEKLCSLW